MSAEKDTLRSAPAAWPASSSRPTAIQEILCNAFNYMANPLPMQGGLLRSHHPDTLRIHFAQVSRTRI
jgi:hypothetical protein